MTTLASEREGHLLSLVLNRPEKANALSSGLIQELTRAFEVAEQDEGLSVVTLAGAGGNFCSGADTNELKGDAEATRRSVEGYVALVSLLSRFSKPLLIGVDGGAVGGGLGLVALGDVVLASERATFRTPELKLGLFPFIVAPLLVPVIGQKRFFEMVYTGRPVGAEEARQWGLVNQVVKQEELPGSLQRLAVTLTANPLTPIRRGKRGVREGESIGRMGEELLGMLKKR